MDTCRILVWEPLFKGHYAFFLELVVRALVQAGWTVTVATDAASPVQLPDGVMRVCTNPRANPSVAPFEIAKDLGITEVFICYLENALLPRNPHIYVEPDLPRNVHGIWMQTHFVFEQGLLNCMIKRDVRRTRVMMQRLKNLSDNGMLGSVFVLDERMLERELQIGIPVGFLPDPWFAVPAENRDEARVRLNLPRDRIIFLHIGSDEKRKGLLNVLKLASKFPLPGPFIVRAGELKPKNTGRHTGLIQRLTGSGNLFCEDRDISEEEFDLYIRAADYVLLPYRSHGNSSGILSRAIGVGTPVVASDFGLIARRVRELNLGFLYKNNDMCDLYRVMLQAARTPADRFPVVKAREMFSPERFMGVIGTRVGKSSRD